MSKWKIFGKSKQKENETKQTEEPTTIESEKPAEDETENQKTEKYSETLYTSESTAKKTSNQTVWRDVDAIEEKVDDLHITRAQKPVTELDKTVDRLLKKRKKK